GCIRFQQGSHVRIPLQGLPHGPIPGHLHLIAIPRAENIEVKLDCHPAVLGQIGQAQAHRFVAELAQEALPAGGRGGGLVGPDPARLSAEVAAVDWSQLADDDGHPQEHRF
ncbi:hypothetical protein V6O07_13775, partial [Arthrospira platensis SPKY2]